MAVYQAAHRGGGAGHRDRRPAGRLTATGPRAPADRAQELLRPGRCAVIVQNYAHRLLTGHTRIRAAAREWVPVG